MSEPKKTGRATKLAKPVLETAQFLRGALVMVAGREDEGPFRVVATTAMKSARTVQCYAERGGKFEWIAESQLSAARKTTT